MVEDFNYGFLNSRGLIYKFFRVLNLNNGAAFGFAVKMIGWQCIDVWVVKDEQ